MNDALRALSRQLGAAARDAAATQQPARPPCPPLRPRAAPRPAQPPHRRYERTQAHTHTPTGTAPHAMPTHARAQMDEYRVAKRFKISVPMGTGTCSVITQVSLLDIPRPILDELVKHLHPKNADLGTLDPSALTSLLDAHPTFRALCSEKDRRWLRFNKSLIPRVIGMAPDYFGGRVVEVLISNMYRRWGRIGIPTDVQFHWGLSICSTAQCLY